MNKKAQTAQNERGLRYTGEGRAVIGFPARDMTPEEVAQYGRQDLLDSGLYTEQDTPTAADRSADKGQS